MALTAIRRDTYGEKSISKCAKVVNWGWRPKNGLSATITRPGIMEEEEKT
jgi:hypothetical protein